MIWREEVSGEISVCHFHSFLKYSLQRGRCQQPRLWSERRIQSEHSNGGMKRKWADPGANHISPHINNLNSRSL